ncbi:hypothetical protein AAVH_06827 [Aphelenchoides avenae]|nr:hypothetical protein AAVH_06827 [Aphelenchus avenae]
MRYGHANTIVARDTMARIFDVYLYVRENKKPPREVAYDVLRNLPAATPKKIAPSSAGTTSDNGNSSGFGGFGDDGGTATGGSGNISNGFGGFGSNIGGSWD